MKPQPLLSPRILVFLLMSLISTLFGCKPASLQGPDFNQTIPKILHIKPGITVTYEMPSNMSNLMNFGIRYPNESPRTITFDTTEEHKFQLWHWRESVMLDGAMWDYKMKGRADLNLRIDIALKPELTSLKSFIASLYEEFYNGENGLNTNFRRKRPNRSDDELGSWIKSIPNDFSEISVNGAPAFTWSEDSRDTGQGARYYALEFHDRYFLTFAFLSSISARNTKELEMAKNKIPQDIAAFMERVHVVQK